METLRVKKCALLGPANTFSHKAGQNYFASKNSMPEFVFSESIKTACRSLKDGEVDYIVLPVENIYKGFVWETFDSIYRTARILIVDEFYQRIRLQLMSNASDITKIRKIYSHYQPFRQCTRHLEDLKKDLGIKFQQMVVESTAQGALAAMEPENVDHSAAIASAEAAAKLGLKIIKQDIHDAPNNTTRFWILSYKEHLHKGSQSKSVFLIELIDEPGSLQRFLKIFSDKKINLRWLQMLNIEKRGKPTYAFFFEVDGHTDNELKDLTRYLKRPNALFADRSLRVVGSFPNITPDWPTYKKSDLE